MEARISQVEGKEESRHKVPQQCLKAPSTVSKKPAKTSTSLARNSFSAAMVREDTLSTPVHIQETPSNHMVEYEAAEAGSSTSHLATGSTPLAKAHKERVDSSRRHARQKEEWVVGTRREETKVLTVTVKAGSPEPQVIGRKRHCGYRPRSERCIDVPPHLRTQQCKDAARRVVAAVRDASFRQAAGFLLSQQYNQGKRKRKN